MRTEFWVTMTDKFMSGWGMAQGKTNKFIIECETIEQARTIQNNAMKRPEMRHINICFNKPRYNSKRYESSFRTYDELGDIWKQK